MARPKGKISDQLSGKHQLVDKANTYLIVASALATVVVIFSIFATIELVGKISYQNKVLGLREEALEQLDENIQAIDQLAASYIAFDSSPESILGTPDKNSKVVLDSLPSKYDFPAFATSLEFIINGSGLSISNITGTDQEIESEKSAINPTPVEVPFTISGSGNYANVQKLVEDLKRSIRPFKIDSIEISGEGDSLNIDISGVSYYQPAKELGVNEQVVKSDEDFKLNIATPAVNGVAE